MIYRLIFVLLTIVLLGSCLPQTDNIDVLHAKDSSYELYLYTKEDNIKNANHYLAALLSWKTSKENQHSFTFKQTTTRSEQIGISHSHLPALIIKKEGKVIKEVYGEVPEDQIVTILKEHLS